MAGLLSSMLSFLSMKRYISTEYIDSTRYGRAVEEGIGKPSSPLFAPRHSPTFPSEGWHPSQESALSLMLRQLYPDIPHAFPQSWGWNGGRLGTQAGKGGASRKMVAAWTFLVHYSVKQCTEKVWQAGRKSTENVWKMYGKEPLFS